MFDEAEFPVDLDWLSEEKYNNEQENYFPVKYDEYSSVKILFH